MFVPYEHDDQDWYVQCDLRKTVLPGVTREYTVYLPAKYAKKGESIQVRINGEWEDGWVVFRVYSKRAGVPNVRKEVKEHRKRTGDSLPKYESSR